MRENQGKCSKMRGNHKKHEQLMKNARKLKEILEKHKKC